MLCVAYTVRRSRARAAQDDGPPGVAQWGDHGAPAPASGRSSVSARRTPPRRVARLGCGRVAHTSELVADFIGGISGNGRMRGVFKLGPSTPAASQRGAHAGVRKRGRAVTMW